MGCNCCCGGLYLAAGSRLTYVADFDLDLWKVLSTNCSNSDILQKVSSYVNNMEGMVVEKADYITHPLTRTVTLNVKTGVDHGGLGTNADEDIREILDHAFWTQANVMPTASRITQYTAANPISGAPATKTPTITGAPCAPPPSNQEKPNNCDPFKNFKFPDLTPLAWGGLIGLLGIGAFWVFLKEA